MPVLPAKLRSHVKGQAITCSFWPALQVFGEHKLDSNALLVNILSCGIEKVGSTSRTHVVPNPKTKP